MKKMFLFLTLLFTHSANSVVYNKAKSATEAIVCSNVRLDGKMIGSVFHKITFDTDEFSQLGDFSESHCPWSTSLVKK